MIKDSGERRTFETGAVRDITEGKGRCDLLPLDVVAYLVPQPELRDIISYLDSFMQEGDNAFLVSVLYAFGRRYYEQAYLSNMLLDVSRHFEEGCSKYGERNWEKGIPLHCYLDSAIRHLFKFVDGWDDESHDRAFVWNIMCAMWTMEHKPEMNDLPCAKTGKVTDDVEKHSL